MRPFAAPHLTPKGRVVALTTVGVVLLHVLVVALWQFGSTNGPLPKRPDVTIEFFTPAPQAVSAPQTPPKHHPPTVAPAPQPHRLPAQPALPVSPEPSTRAALTQAPVAPAPQVDAAAPAPPPSATPTDVSTLATTNSDADYKASYLNNPKPPYPLSAVRQRAEGRVVLWAEVLPDGRAGRVRVEQSSGHALLDASAMNTVRAWRFTPARQDGVVTTQAVRIPIDFTLQEQR